MNNILMLKINEFLIIKLYVDNLGSRLSTDNKIFI